MEVKLDILGAQVINFLIIFFLFKKFLWDSIIKTIEERRVLIKKLKSADYEYERAINDAKMQAEKIIVKAQKKANDIISDSEIIAIQEKDSIIKQAEEKAEIVLKNAEKESKKLEINLVNNWTNSVKSTSTLLLKKILWNHETLQDQYLDTLIDDLKK